jgi:hypothetical protein
MTVPFLLPNAHFDGLLHEASGDDDGVQFSEGRFGAAHSGLVGLHRIEWAPRGVVQLR